MHIKIKYNSCLDPCKNGNCVCKKVLKSTNRHVAWRYAEPKSDNNAYKRKVTILPKKKQENWIRVSNNLFSFFHTPWTGCDELNLTSNGTFCEIKYICYHIYYSTIKSIYTFYGSIKCDIKKIIIFLLLKFIINLMKKSK